MEQIMHTQPGPVLDEKGRPFPGYSTHSVLTYNRNQIKAPAYRIKEWDFYQISNEELCLQFTIGHTSYVGQVSVMLFNFATGEKILYKEKLIPLPFGKMGMGTNAESDSTLKYDKGGMYMEFITKDGVRTLKCKCEEVETEIVLRTTMPHSLVINIPFDEKETQFYYNHKINCMTAEGYVKNGDKEYKFDPADSYGILDWGRGVWTYSNTWYWGSASGLADGVDFGFNIGYGFGDTSAASENMLFYAGKAHKLSRVTFHIPMKNGKEDYLQPWRFTSDDGRFEMDFRPVINRASCTDVKLIKSDQNQVFGRFTGTAVLDDGTRLQVRDLFGFAEKVENKW